MPIDPGAPDLVTRLRLDPYAPRAARFRVREVDSPSPDLRDAVVLLTSEIVTRAVEQRSGDAADSVELRVWMPPDVVRVELRAPCELLADAQPARSRDYDLMLLDCIADRWSLDHESDGDYLWFEIDRQPARAEGSREEDSSRSLANHG
jgi:hypothetical protein